MKWISWNLLRGLKSVKLGGELEDGNYVLYSPCSLLVVECCVGCGCVIGFCYMVVVWVEFPCVFCLLHVL